MPDSLAVASQASLPEWQGAHKFHVCQCIWDPEIGEQLNCTIERNNPHDRFAVAVTKEDEIVGHTPKEYSRICSFFLRHGGKISCVVTGARCNRGLAYGLEVPVKYFFVGTESDKTPTSIVTTKVNFCVYFRPFTLL